MSHGCLVSSRHVCSIVSAPWQRQHKFLTLPLHRRCQASSARCWTGCRRRGCSPRRSGRTTASSTPTSAARRAPCTRTAPCVSLWRPSHTLVCAGLLGLSSWTLVCCPSPLLCEPLVPRPSHCVQTFDPNVWDLRFRCVRCSSQMLCVPWAAKLVDMARETPVGRHGCNVFNADLDKVVTVTLGGPALIAFRRSLPDGSASPEVVTEVQLSPPLSACVISQTCAHGCCANLNMCGRLQGKRLSCGGLKEAACGSCCLHVRLFTMSPGDVAGAAAAAVLLRGVWAGLLTAPARHRGARCRRHHRAVLQRRGSGGRDGSARDPSRAKGVARVCEEAFPR